MGVGGVEGVRVVWIVGVAGDRGAGWWGAEAVSALHVGCMHRQAA